ncbi:MAG TPA: hypothetical protein VHZ95_09045 [Polyangiales bacterium]|nr:hypothetical protein [Polyangiales bacterium]
MSTPDTTDTLPTSTEPDDCRCDLSPDHPDHAVHHAAWLAIAIARGDAQLSRSERRKTLAEFDRMWRAARSSYDRRLASCLFASACYAESVSHAIASGHGLAHPSLDAYSDALADVVALTRPDLALALARSARASGGFPPGEGHYVGADLLWHPRGPRS